MGHVNGWMDEQPPNSTAYGLGLQMHTDSRTPIRFTPKQTMGWLMRPDHLLGWRWREGSAGWYCKPEFATFTRINAHGLRDRPREYAATSGVRRLLVLGDSFCAGLEVPREQSFTAQLETQLFDQSVPWEVINAGTGGYGTEQAYLFWLAEGWRYRPDIVLLAFHAGDDVIENWGPLAARVRWRQTKLPRPRVLFEGERPRLGRQPSARALRQAWNYYYYQLPLPLAAASQGRTLSVSDYGRWGIGLLQRLKRPRHQGPGEAPFELNAYREPPDDDWRSAWEHTRALLHSLQRSVAQRGARLVVMNVATKEQVLPNGLSAVGEASALQYYAPNAPAQWMCNVAEHMGAPFLDLGDTFREALEAGNRLFFEHDLHWSPTGHSLAASAIARWLAPHL